MFHQHQLLIFKDSTKYIEQHTHIPYFLNSLLLIHSLGVEILCTRLNKNRGNSLENIILNVSLKLF